MRREAGYKREGPCAPPVRRGVGEGEGEEDTKKWGVTRSPAEAPENYMQQQEKAGGAVQVQCMVPREH